MITGIDEVDKLLKKDKQLILLAARPGMGKTSLTLEIASKYTDNGKTVVYIRTDNIVVRVRDGVEYVEKADIANKDLKLIDQKIPLDCLIECISDKCEKERPDLIIIDDLQSYDPFGIGCTNEKAETVRSVIGEEFLKLREIFDCTVIVISSVSRMVERRRNHRPMLDDIRGLRGIIDKSDSVMFLYREKYYNWKTDTKDRISEVIIAKADGGCTGTVYLNREIS